MDNHPGRKALPDVILDDKDPANRLTSMQVQSEGGTWADDEMLRKMFVDRGVENADESLAALKDAAGDTRDIYIDIRNRLVRAGIMTQDTSDLLAHHYPWYNPINYVEYANRTHKGKDYDLNNVVQESGKFNLKHDGFYEFSEQPEVMGALPPLGETLLTSLIRNEMRIANNEITKAVVKMGIATKIGLRNVTDEFANKMVDYDDSAKSGYLIFYDDGVRQVYGGSDGKAIPKWLWESLNGTGGLNLQGESYSGLENATAFTTGFYRSVFTTYNPVFFSRNALNDSFTAWLRAGVLPPKTYQRMIMNLWDAAFQVERRAQK